MREISTLAFEKAVEQCMEEQVDFILIAGDFFNTTLPSLDLLKRVTAKLRELKEKGIPVYVVPGSHDFSVSGKTMLDVLENAALLSNVLKGEEVDGKLKLHFTVDKKTGAKITGMLGRRGELEKSYYLHLLREHLEQEGGYKIFLFHSAIEELKPKELEAVASCPLSMLPRNFSYYAGGHVHTVMQKHLQGYGCIAYPGPLFPCNFAELEKLGGGGYYLVEDGKGEWKPIQIYNVLSLSMDAQHKTPKEVEEELSAAIKGKEFNRTIVTIRVAGCLREGKPSDINFKEIFQHLYEHGAYFVMKNTSHLTTKEFEEIAVAQSTIEELEKKLIQEHLGQATLPGIPNQEQLIQSMMQALSTESGEEESKAEFEERMRTLVLEVLGMSRKA
ncbi:DNA repair exonuclease [Candidatus Woesearchaeota archaeon]|nr:DNA repair exonuclease [Candidatus Woesearchaeota archaeon]